MKRTGVLLVFLTALALSPREPAVAGQARAGARFVDYFGYSDCIELKNENVRVILCPHGARVLEYSWRGKNSVYLDPGQRGWTYAPGTRPVDPCGGRLDIGPEMIIPRHPDLWLGKWEAEVIGPRAARLTSVKDKATGTQLIRQFSLDPSSSKLTCTQTIKNVSNELSAWCHWSRTLAQGGGICLIPLTPHSRFPANYVMYGPDSSILYRPKDPNIRVREGFLEIRGTPQYPKLGMDSHAGWLCYLLKTDLMLVKRFPTFPDRVYNEIAGLTISIWYYKDVMCELEPIGPMERLAPGESASFAEEWWLAPFEFPKEGNDVDLDEVRSAIEKMTRKSQ